MGESSSESFISPSHIINDYLRERLQADWTLLVTIEYSG